jgi:hypothetical protein
LIVPVLVISEVAHFLARLGPHVEGRFLGDVIAGTFEPEPPTAADWRRIEELVTGYSSLPLGTVDASVIATAERLGAHEVATIDRRDFTVVRPKHGPLTLLP